MKRLNRSSKKIFLLIALIFVFVITQISSANVNTLPQEKKAKTETTETKKSSSKSETSVKKSDEKQLICAVTGEEADPSLKMEYKGKTYYFCCKKCVKKFKENPEKYIKS